MKSPPSFKKNLFHLSATAIHVSFSILSGGLLGDYLDSVLNTQPLFLLIGIAGGIVSAGFAIKRLTQKIEM